MEGTPTPEFDNLAKWLSRMQNRTSVSRYLAEFADATRGAESIRADGGARMMAYRRETWRSGRNSNRDLTGLKILEAYFLF